MKPTDNLHQLIKSLTSSEKRYFKVHAKRHVVGTKNKYEQLFDVYDALPDEDYDERELKQKLQKKALGKNLADDKKNLQEMIMKAMLAFHAGHSVDNQLNELLAEEDFYRQKRLNDLRRKTISKAKELAEKYEKYTVLLTLIDREHSMRLEIDQNNLKGLAESTDKMQNEIITKINILSKLRTINNWLFIQYRMNMHHDHTKMWDDIDKKVTEPILKNYQPGNGFSCDLNYFKIWSTYYQMKGDHVKQSQYGLCIYELFEKHYPHQKDNNRLAFKVSFYNYLYSLYAVKDFDKMGKMLSYAETIEPINEDEAGEDFQNIVFYRQLYYMNMKYFNDACKMVNQIEEGLRKHKKKINKAREITMYINIAIAFMMNERWQQVIDYTERIIKDKTEVKVDIKHEAMILQLIARFELDQYDLLSYQIRNTQRYLTNNYSISDPQNNILKLFSKLLKNGKSYFKELDSESIISSMGYSSVQIWLYSRIKKKTLVKASSELEL